MCGHLADIVHIIAFSPAYVRLCREPLDRSGSRGHSVSPRAHPIQRSLWKFRLSPDKRSANPPGSLPIRSSVCQCICRCPFPAGNLKGDRCHKPLPAHFALSEITRSSSKYLMCTCSFFGVPQVLFLSEPGTRILGEMQQIERAESSYQSKENGQVVHRSFLSP